ncbi:MAG: glycerate dehydrogenase, partial [Verrucomicrobiota bacterium]
MRPRGIFLLKPDSAELIYGPEQRAAIAELVEITDRLEGTEVIFSGWGAPVMDEKFLAAAPALRAVFYGAGSIRGFVTEAFWQRGILVTSAYAANAVAVSEYTLATILLSLKHFWRQSATMRAAKARPAKTMPVPGA